MDEVFELRQRNNKLETGLKDVLKALEDGITPPDNVIKELRELIETPISTPWGIWEQKFTAQQVKIEPSIRQSPDPTQPRPCCN